MSIIIRLQNLPWSANSMDIRTYFQGLSIPEGGVHIVGGEQGDAFIAFSTDEDARQAMMNDGGKIKDGKIKLLLSSRSEMQKVIEQARQTTLSFQNTIQSPQVNPTPTATPQSNLAPMGLMTQMGMTNPLMSQQATVGLAQQIPHGAQLLGQNPMQTGPQAQLSAAALPIQNQTNNLDQQTLAQKDWQGSMPMGLSGPGIPPQAAQLGMPGLMPGMPPHLAMMGMIPGMSAAQFAQMAQMGLLGPNPLANFPALLYAQQQKQPAVPGAQPTPPNIPSTETPSSALQMTPNVHPVFSQAPSNQFPPSFNQTPGSPALSQVPAPRVITPTDRDNVQSDSKDDSDDVKIISEEKDTRRSTRSRSKSRERRKGDKDRYERRDRDRYDRRRRSRSRSRSRERRRRERREKERKSRRSRSRSRERTRFSKEPTKDSPKIAEDGKNGFEPNKSNKEETAGTNKPFPVPAPNQNPALVPPVHVPFSNIDTTLKMPDMKTPFSNNGPKQGPASWSNNPNMKTPEPNTCIEIRNVPNNVRYVDIKSFFQHYPLYQDGIKIINDKAGKRTGIIYVQFLRTESKERALNDLNGKFFLESQVELFPIEDEIFQKAVDSFRPARNASGQEPPSSLLPPIVIFKVLSVPASVTRQKIAQIFGDIELETVRVNREDPARTMVFVKIKNETDAQQFTLVRKTHMIDNKPVLVVPCFESEFAEAVKKFPDEPDPIKTDCILIKNLPKHTNDRDVGDLFSDIALSPLKIHMMFTAEGEPSGDVFCEFATPEEANRAVTKNETVFGRNTVSVLLVSRQTLNEALGTPLPAPPKMFPPGMSLLGARPPHSMPEFMNPQFSDNPGGPMGNGLGIGPNGSTPYMGPNGGSMNMGSRPERFPSFDRGRVGMRGRGRGRGGYPGGYDARFFDPSYERFNDGPPHNRGGPPDQDSDITSPENFGKPGCVLALENIPYRASMDEILGFFRDFELTRDNIIRRYDEDGRPTGDARVCLVSPSEAQRALGQLNRQYIQNRMIHLSLV